MAMPLSGCLGIISCPGGTCTSIAQAVDGNVTPPKSLSALSVSAGKSAPHSMLEFYGYAPVTTKTLSILPISTQSTLTVCCTCGCLQPSGVVPVGDCYYPNYSWAMTANNINVSQALVCVICNGVGIYQCSVSSKAYNCSGTWTTIARKVDYNDLIHIVTCVSIFGESIATARVSLDSITQCVGTYCKGSPTSQVSGTGFLPE
jgi:hypothetical protein